MDEVPQPKMKAKEIERLSKFVSEFIVNYRSTKYEDSNQTSGKVRQSTLKGYLCGIARVLAETFPETECNLFHSKTLMTVIDNYSKSLERDGMMSESHNTLSLADVRAVFAHLNECERTAHGYRDRLVFAVGLATGFRPTALYLLRNEQLRIENVRGQRCVVFYRTTGRKSGERKTTGDG